MQGQPKIASKNIKQRAWPGLLTTSLYLLWRDKCSSVLSRMRFSDQPSYSLINLLCCRTSAAVLNKGPKKSKKAATVYWRFKCFHCLWIEEHLHTLVVRFWTSGSFILKQFDYSLSISIELILNIIIKSMSFWYSTGRGQCDGRLHYYRNIMKHLNNAIKIYPL